MPPGRLLQASIGRDARSKLIRVGTLLGFVLMLILIPSSVASVDFHGDWDTCDYSQWNGIQVGRNYNPDGSWTLRKTPAQQMPIVRDVVREGPCAAKVVLEPGDYAYNTNVEAALAQWRGKENQGSDYYYGVSMRFPSDWGGSNGWGYLLEWQAYDWYNFPSYGNVLLDAGDPSKLQLIFHTGKTPDRGAASYDPEYNRTETLLDPLPKGVWLDFIFHVRWSAYWDGIFTVWYREQGSQTWRKLYDNTGAGDAVINRPPHPTWMRNSLGTPEALTLIGYYSAKTPWTRTYWFDNFVRGTSFSDVAQTWGDAGTPLANSSLPLISGTALVGQSLTASTGAWSGSPTSYAYQWRRCDSTGAGCADIAGATGSSYTVVSADVGHTLRVVVKASNSTGTSSATSAATALVSSRRWRRR